MIGILPSFAYETLCHLHVPGGRSVVPRANIRIRMQLLDAGINTAIH